LLDEIKQLSQKNEELTRQLDEEQAINRDLESQRQKPADPRAPPGGNTPSTERSSGVYGGDQGSKSLEQQNMGSAIPQSMIQSYDNAIHELLRASRYGYIS
jgi:hypothetical protein